MLSVTVLAVLVQERDISCICVHAVWCSGGQKNSNACLLPGLCNLTSSMNLSLEEIILKYFQCTRVIDFTAVKKRLFVNVINIL